MARRRGGARGRVQPAGGARPPVRPPWRASGAGTSPGRRPAPPPGGSAPHPPRSPTGDAGATRRPRSRGGRSSRGHGRARWRRVRNAASRQASSPSYANLDLHAEQTAQAGERRRPGFGVVGESHEGVAPLLPLGLELARGVGERDGDEIVRPLENGVVANL